MDTLSIVFVGAIIATAFGFSLWPLFQTSEVSIDSSSSGDREGQAASEIARLFSEREQAYKNIMEIDLDREMGKLSDEDYEDMISQARADAVEVLRRLETRGVKEGMVPAHVNVNEVEEAAARAAGGEAARDGAPVDGSSGPAYAASSVSNDVLDRRLEEEILRFRKVEASTEQVNGESENLPSQRFCPSCGTETDAGHNFCASCGEKLN